MYSRNEHTGLAGVQTYAFTFPYLLTTNVHVYVNGVETTNFTIVGGDVVIAAPAILAGDAIVIARLTGITDVEQLVDWASGAAMSEEQLDLARLQATYLLQEHQDITELAEPHIDDDTIHVPGGGTADQVLVKLSAVSGDCGWAGGLIFSLPTPPDGCILTFDGAGNPYVLAPGTIGQVLTCGGPGALPYWA